MEPREMQELVSAAETKIVMLVMDGLGGLPLEPGGPTELEAAYTPHMDALARQGICGLHVPVDAGITPGSGPSHLALFGYDPERYEVGRGALSAVGIGFDLQPGDIAARGNFCTVDERGEVVDRRAGRIATELNARLCERLRSIDLPGARLFVQPEKDYRFVLVLRGEGLHPAVEDTDPQAVGRPPLAPRPREKAAAKTAELVGHFVSAAREVLAEERPANMVLLRGFAERPRWPSMRELFGLHAAAIAAYPMYRGLAQLIGMEVVPCGERLEDEIEALRASWADFDFFYVHAKKTDSAGEDGDFAGKARQIEAVDALVPRIMDLHPDVVLVTGDHSTPALLRAHSWHPVPVLLWSRHCRSDAVERFGERGCMAGGLGPRFPAVKLMPLLLANARRLAKLGA